MSSLYRSIEAALFNTLGRKILGNVATIGLSAMGGMGFVAYLLSVQQKTGTALNYTNLYIVLGVSAGLTFSA